jgi:hypothetical protein
MNKIEELAKLAEKIQGAREFCDGLEKHLKANLLIEGKTIIEWRNHFRVKFTPDMTFADIVALAADIADKYQEAGRMRDMHNFQLSILEQTKTDKYNEAYTGIQKEYEDKHKKRLAAEKCKVAAQMAVTSFDNAIATQKMVHSFWVGICNGLVELRKLLEIIGRSLGADARVGRDFVVRGR